MNTIQIKHGENSPGVNVLAPYELGYVESNGSLVIGVKDKEAKKLNYLQVDENGYVPILNDTGSFFFTSTSQFPKVLLSSVFNGKQSRSGFGLDGENGQNYFLQYAPTATKFEKYDFPVPEVLESSNKTYSILTSKGGSFAGEFVFNGKITTNNAIYPNGAIIVGSKNYGSDDPNDANIPGVVGQLYFVLTE